MACRGVYFAISDEELKRLLNAKDDEQRLSIFQDEIEQKWDEEWLYEMDKSWDALHRCLADGSLGMDNDPKPLSLCVLGGRQLYSGDDYIISLKTTLEVTDLARALSSISQQDLLKRYFAIAPDYAMDLNEQDFQYTWDYFSGLPEFLAKAASAGRHVVFTVDQ